MARIELDLARGTLIVDGDEKFVQSIYNDAKLHFANRPFNAEAETPVSDDTVPASSTSKATRKRAAKTGGPSCASRIDALKAEDFFKELRSPKEISDKLKEKGTTYASNQIAAALISMTKGGRLRRINQNGWKYQNP